MILEGAEAVAGGALLFFLPGFTSTKALFPEWHLLKSGWIRAVELLTLSLVVSVAYTILVGFVLGNLPGSLFQAGWSDPLLEAILGGFAAVAFVIGLLRGSYSLLPLAKEPGSDVSEKPGTWETVTSLEWLRSRRRTIEVAMRSADAPRKQELTRELEQIQRTEEELRAQREAEFAK